MLLAALALAAALAPPSCWGVYDAAMYRNAHSPHAHVIAYDESFALREGDTQIAQREQHLRYGDGAQIDPEPGPPELGPYGTARAKWLGGGPHGLDTIARLRVAGEIECTYAGRERYGDRSVHHITFSARNGDLPQVRDLWVDAATSDIWKLAGYGTIFFNDGGKRIAQFDVSLQYVGPYLLVNRVVWTSGLYTGEYRLHNFAFPLDAVMGKVP